MFVLEAREEKSEIQLENKKNCFYERMTGQNIMDIKRDFFKQMYLKSEFSTVLSLLDFDPDWFKRGANKRFRIQTKFVHCL